MVIDRLGDANAAALPSWIHASAWRWAFRSLSAVLMVLGLWLIVFPQWRDALEILPRLSRVPAGMLVLAAFTQAVSLLSFSVLTSLITRLRFGPALRIDLADLAVNHTVPGGGGVAAAARYRMLIKRGIPSHTAVAVATVEVTLSNVMLGVLFATGLLLTLGTLALTEAELWAGATVIILLGATGCAVWILFRHPGRLAAAIDRLETRVPLVRRMRLRAVLAAAQQQLETLGQRPRRLIVCAAFAFGNWTLDALSLWLILAALGSIVAPGPVLVAYGAGTILAQLPLTPGGIGLVEGVLVPTLTAFGVPAPSALLGVLGWRVLEYWLPIPAGAISALSLRAGTSGRRPRDSTAS